MDEKKLPIIACWGDSITESMGMADENRYPHQLEKMLGGRFRVLNGGDGGENTLTIMARQGALQLFTEKDIFFDGADSQTVIGDQKNVGFVSKDGDPIFFTSALGRELPVNPVKIGDKLFFVGFQNFSWDPFGYAFTLTRSESEHELKIPAGTPVVFNSSDCTLNSYCDVYLMGANGGFGDDPQNLIAHFKAMADRHGNDRYLVVVPHWTGAYDELFDTAFGDHAVHLRKSAIADGLSYEGITPNDSDRQEIEKGLLPASLCYQDKPDIHLNAHGYHFLAHLLYERGKALGYW